MPHRALAVTTRHHPISVSFYFGIMVLATLYLIGRANASSMIAEVGSRITFIWQIMLLIGGVTAFVGVWLPKRLIVKGLILEALGALLIGVELGVYAIVMLGLEQIPWATVLVFGPLSVGCVCRTFTARKDRNRVILALAKGTVASPPPLGDPSDDG